jgi:ABC-type uncharacterized transport system permease subunit
MLPVALYPDFIQRAAALTPFPTLLAAPASFVLQNTSVTPGSLALHLAIWWGATALAMNWIFRRAASALTVNGG